MKNKTQQKENTTMNNSKKIYKEDQPIKAMIDNKIVDCLFYDYFKEDKCLVDVNEQIVVIRLDAIID